MESSKAYEARAADTSWRASNGASRPVTFCARAPAVLDHEARRREGVERGDEIRAVTAKARRHLVVAERDVVALPHVVEREHLHHDVMDSGLAGLDEGEAVVARIDVQEARLERMRIIVREPKAEQIAVERHNLIDLF